MDKLFDLLKVKPKFAAAFAAAAGFLLWGMQNSIVPKPDNNIEIIIWSSFAIFGFITAINITEFAKNLIFKNNLIIRRIYRNNRYKVFVELINESSYEERKLLHDIYRSNSRYFTYSMYDRTLCILVSKGIIINGARVNTIVYPDNYPFYVDKTAWKIIENNIHNII